MTATRLVEESESHVSELYNILRRVLSVDGIHLVGSAATHQELERSVRRMVLFQFGSPYQLKVSRLTPV